MPLGNKVTGLKEHYDNYNKITATTNQSPLVYTAGKLSPEMFFLCPYQCSAQSILPSALSL